MKHRTWPLWVLLLLVSPLWAQRTARYTDKQACLRKAQSLYQQEQYKAAQHFFRQELSQANTLADKELCNYYIASAAIRLRQPGADKLMVQYLKDYPTSSYAAQANLEVGDYYFDRGDTKTAILWYDKVEIPTLSSKQKEKFDFQYGYALFAHGDKETAQQYLSQVKDSKHYGKKAAYYLGYIAYDADDYQKANDFFQQVGEKEELSRNISYYQADMNFKQGNFQKALEEALLQLEKTNNSQYRSEINKIIGESYFNLKEYAKAIPYLEAYKGKNGAYTNTDLYYLGYAYYKQGDYEKAIGQFNQIINGRNEVAQNAYYHLAQCYLKTDQKQQALNAFRNAHQMNFVPEIRRDAHLNYARLSYDIGNAYESTPSVIQAYLDTYPKDEHTQELKGLLLDSYISSGSLQEALTLLEKSASADPKIYQQVAFLYALQRYGDGQFKEALPYFEKAKRSKADAILQARATYWSAETAYQLHQYAEAQRDFQAFLEQKRTSLAEYPKALYGLAYALFNQKKYAEAAPYFTKYIETQPDALRLSDAYLRLGDSHFGAGQYWPAMDAYDKVIDTKVPSTDYPAFQKAISYGIVDRAPKKIEALEAFIKDYPQSNLREDALYELANTYVSQGKPEKATELYKILQTDYKGGTYTVRAMLREGLMLYNKNENQKALAIFKEITEKYPSSAEALQAVSTAKNIYAEQGKMEEYAAWAKGLGYVKISDSELDSAAFDAAESLYVQGKKQEAKLALEKYLKDYPKGGNASQARFFLAQLYYEGNQKTKALPLYEKVLEEGRNEHSEQVLLRLSQLYLEKQEWGKVLPLLKELESTSAVLQNVLFARTNLMRCFYQQKDYPQAIAYAQKVLAEKTSAERAKSDAHLILARAYMATGSEAEAEKEYALLRKNATDALMAEALYYDAYFKNKAKQYKKSNEVVQKLAKEYGGYKEFSAKGLVLMAKNFYGLKDLYQANYILSSVLENFKDYPEVIAQAKEAMELVKTSEKKSNK
ncbi:MAG: tetratricopeptide repeat protein [Capnocytophaga sp.]|nr:MAG: tetratricopeptide repeat protein [Capnocytophaga sp.]